MMKIQITLFSNKGYRPISTLVKVANIEEIKTNSKQIKTKAIAKMCAARRWTTADLKTYGYKEVKCRIYDEEKIAAENAARYEQIKKERGWA